MQGKIVSCLLAVFMIFAFTACSEKNSEVSLYSYDMDSDSVSDSDFIQLENKYTGYVWNSGDFSSSLTYGIPSEKSIKTINSSDEKCRISVSEITKGVKVTYNYYKTGIKYSVEYTDEKDFLKASIRTSEIEENGDAVALKISVLPLLSSAVFSDEGYFVIPDGCGALIRFSDKKNSYSQRVYGDNISLVPDKKASDKKQVYLPCYGAVKNGNAFLAVAVKGDSNVFINADTGELNTCNFSFVIRDTDNFSINKSDITVFEDGDINCDDIEVRYYPIEKYNAGYSDIAEKYRQYIMDTCNLSPLSEDYEIPLYINFYGGVEKKTSVSGIPSEKKISLTEYSQAEEILRELKNNNVENITASYYNWTDSQICRKIDTNAECSDILGNSEDFKKLYNYAEIYPVVDNIKFSELSLKNMTVRISGAYSKISEYNPVYNIQDSSADSLYFLSPSRFKQIYNRLEKNYSYDKINFGSLSVSLYGNYSKKKFSRFDALNSVCKSCELFDKKILAYGANAYMFPYVNHICGVPAESSHFDIFDEDIPFYQMIIHGLIPYSSESVNSMANPDDYIKKSVSYGSSLMFDFIYENPAVLQDTDLKKYYYADYSGWKDTALSGYEYSYNILNSVKNCFIEDYYISDGFSFTVYSDGTVIKEGVL